MKFSAIMLYINDAIPTTKDFEDLIAKGNSKFIKNKNLYYIEQTLIDDRFYWMYIQYDNQELYTETVIDTTNYEQKKNPRPKTQIELRYQLFVCYDILNSKLYISDYSKKSVITDYISDALQVNATTKNIFKSIDEFLNINKFLKSVTFCQKRNIANSSSDSMFSKISNIYGLDIPEKYKIKLEYGASPIGQIKGIAQAWKIQRDRDEFEDIIIVGLDDNGFESSFNYSTMLSSIEFDSAKDQNDRHIPEYVKTILLKKLG